MSAYSETQAMTEEDTLSGQQNSVSWDGNIGDKRLKLVESTLVKKRGTSIPVFERSYFKQNPFTY